MDIVGIELNRLPAVLANRRLGLESGRGHRIRFGHIDAYAIYAEIGVKFRVAVVLVKVPALRLTAARPGGFIYAHFGKPLARHDKIAGGAHTGKHLWQLHFKLNF
ncbi:hypothetical protein D1872_255620 [compost metagenome]